MLRDTTTLCLGMEGSTKVCFFPCVCVCVCEGEGEEKKTKGETNNADEDEEDDLEPDLFVIGYGCTIHKDTKLHEATNSTSLLQAWNEDNSLLMDRYHAPFQAFLVHLRCFLLLHF